MAVLFIDLDGFKEVNDTLGHDRGDLLLREAARRLQTCVRQADVVARLAGDEFSIVLSNLSGAEDVSIVIDRVIAALEQPMQLGEDWANVSASVGVALTGEGDESADELLRRADAAMYQAKRARKSRRTTPVR